MLNVLNDLILDEKLDLYLDEFDKEKLLNTLEKIDKNVLYKSLFHGLHHSEKVLLFSYLIGKHENLNEEEMSILIDAAIYHDIGRVDESEDVFHGYASANKISNVVKNKEIYKNKENLEILKFICDAHSVSDNKIERILDNYEIKNKELAKKLAFILKDADALDRARFQKTSIAALKSCYLRYDYATTLVGFAHKVNAYYRDKINELTFLKFSKICKDEKIVCMHGIGFNFPVFESILKYGILSNYAKKNLNLVTTRNYFGNNGDNFISVCVKDGLAKKTFIDNGISFEVEVPYLINGELNKSFARSNGLPIDSKLYDDEMFAFYKIDKEKIKKIKINPLQLDLNVTDLNYLNGSNNYESISNNIDFYLNYLRINFNYFPDIARIEFLKNKYIEIIISYEKLNVENQKANQTLLFENIDSLKKVMDKEIGLMYEDAFKKVLNIKNVTVKDIIFYILNKLDLDFKFDNGCFITKDYKLK